MTFQEYQAAVERAYKENLHWRRGQAAFNVLLNNRPDLSEQVRGSGIDPFHKDDLLSHFYQWVENNWEAQA